MVEEQQKDVGFATGVKADVAVKFDAIADYKKRSRASQLELVIEDYVADTFDPDIHSVQKAKR